MGKAEGASIQRAWMWTLMGEEAQRGWDSKKHRTRSAAEVRKYSTEVGTLEKLHQVVFLWAWESFNRWILSLCWSRACGSTSQAVKSLLGSNLVSLDMAHGQASMKVTFRHKAARDYGKIWGCHHFHRKRCEGEDMQLWQNGIRRWQEKSALDWRAGAHCTEQSLTIYSGFHSARTNNPSSSAEGHRAGTPLSQPRSDRACAEMELIKSWWT